MAVRLILDKTMDEKNVTRYALSKATGISYPIIYHYYKNKVTRYDSYILDKICAALECDIADLIVREK